MNIVDLLLDHGATHRRFLSEAHRATIRRAFAQIPRGKAGRTVVSAAQIDAFLAELDVLCAVKKVTLDQPTRGDARRTREAVLTSCTRTLKALRRIERRELILWHEDTMDGTGPGDHTWTEFLWILHEARAAIQPLQEFTKRLQTYHDSQAKKREGRPVADNDHFIRMIADIYRNTIGRQPTAYENGPFCCVVRSVLEILQRRCDDPARAIRAALK